MASRQRGSLVAGVDIGGTFTDVVLLEEKPVRCTRQGAHAPHDPNEAVARGLRRILAQQRLDPAAVVRVVHATTLFTNALIERRGAAVGLVTTQGFRDTIEIGRERKYELYDLHLEMPRPLCPRERRFEVKERTDAAGRVVVALDESGLLEVVHEALRSGVESLALCFLNSFANPQNERAARAILRRAFPQLPVSVSSEVANEIREYDRFSTAVANAYIQPLAERYLRDFARSVRDRASARRCTEAVQRPLRHAGARGRGADQRSIRPAGGPWPPYFGRMSGTAICGVDIRGTTAKLAPSRRRAAGHPQLRGRTRAPVRPRQRPADPHPHHRPDRDRRRRRQHRPPGPARPAEDRPAQRGIRSGAGELWARRDGTDGDRFQSPARPAQPGVLRQRRDPPRPARRPGGARAAGGPARTRAAAHGGRRA